MSNPPDDILELHEVVTSLDLAQIFDDGLDIPRIDSNTSTPRTQHTSPDTADTEPAKEAQIWAYLGVNGGAGVTSLAVQTTWQLAQNGMDVLLVDLDFERGDCAAYFDVPPGMSIAELNKTEGRMDADLAASFIQTLSPSTSLISGKPELGGNDLVSPTALLALLDSVSSMFDIVILDVAPMWRSWTQAAIGAADKFALVTEARVPALHQTKKLYSDIMQAMDLANPPHVILNKFERRSLRGGLSLADARNVLSNIPCEQICVDEETLRIAINTGQPAGALKPKSRYVKSVHAHVENWRPQSGRRSSDNISQPDRPERRAAR